MNFGLAWSQITSVQGPRKQLTMTGRGAVSGVAGVDARAGTDGSRHSANAAELSKVFIFTVLKAERRRIVHPSGGHAGIA